MLFLLHIIQMPNGYWKAMHHIDQVFLLTIYLRAMVKIRP